MALIRLDHVAESVGVNLPLYMIIPDPPGMNGVPVRARKVLYLLHGLSDDGSGWQRYSSIETYANAYGLVVVMPSAGRSFYLDQPNGQRYFTYIMDEIPRYLEEVFGLAPRREDTLLAGLSMGGYGALKAALLRPERFHAVAAFSGVVSLNILATHSDDARKAEFEHLFGDLSQLPGSRHDPAVWLREAATHIADYPRLFVACGRQDDLYPLNVMFRDACASLGVPLDYHEEDGGHVWPFWDKQIQRFLAAVLGPVTY
jgi:S-formylglutathione hydrolase FrmB